jgi:hypothetical protein
MRMSRAVLACLFGFLLLGLVEQASAAQLIVAWDRSPDPAVAGYVVSYGTQSRSYTSSIVAGNATSATLPGLYDGATYYIVVQSYDSQGTRGTPSVEVVGQTPPGPFVAPPPTPVSVTCPSPVVTSPDGKPVAVSLLATPAGGTQPVAVGCTPPSGSLFSVGTTPFSCTATDALQQTASCSSAVVVMAPVAPPPALSLTCASPLVSSPDGKPVTVSTLATPKGGALPVTVACTPAAGSLFNVGTTSFSCAATDAVKQTASCASTVTVTTQAVAPTPTPRPPTSTPGPPATPPAPPTNVPGPPATPPGRVGDDPELPPTGLVPPVGAETALAIACPVIGDVTAPGNSPKAIVRFAEPVVSGGRLPIAVSCTPRSGSLFDLGTTNVSCVATDADQNVAACMTTATVR